MNANLIPCTPNFLGHALRLHGELEYGYSLPSKGKDPVVLFVLDNHEVEMPVQLIAEHLLFPDGLEIVGASWDAFRQTVDLHVTSDEYPKGGEHLLAVYEDCEDGCPHFKELLLVE